MRLHLRSSALALAMILIACSAEPDEAEPETGAGELGSYEVDGTTGETRAVITNEDGTTTMRAGDRVPARLPDGFTAYPGAEIINTVNIGRGEGRGVLMSFVSDDTQEELVAFYRKQAEAAGVDIELSLQSGTIGLIGGEAPDGTTVSLQTDREDSRTTGQLTVSRGLN